MPALPPVPNVLRVDVEWLVGGDSTITTKLYFRYSGGPPTSTDCQNFASTIWSNMSSIRDLWPPSHTLEGVKVTDLSSASGGVGIHAETAVGSRTGISGSGGLALLTNYVINRRYRGGKPRSYWPFGTATDLSTPQAWDGTMMSDVATSLSSFFASTIGEVQGTTTITDHVNVSYYEGFHVITTPSGRMKNVSNVRSVPVVDTVVTWAASVRPASQRRRN